MMVLLIVRVFVSFWQILPVLDSVLYALPSLAAILALFYAYYIRSKIADIELTLGRAKKLEAKIKRERREKT